MVGLIRIVSADWIFPPGKAPVKDGALLLDGEVIIEVGTRRKLLKEVEGAEELHLEKSALLPGLINSHTHLELSSIGRIAAENGFAGWVRELLERKTALTEEEILTGADKAIIEMLAMGTAYVADVSSGFLTAVPLIRAGYAATIFREFLGLSSDAGAEFDRMAGLFQTDSLEGVRILPSCHAPYSTSGELFRSVGAWSSKNACPTMVHVAESRDEVELLTEGGGGFVDLLKDRDIEASLIPVPKLAPVKYLDRLGFLTEHTIAVHLVEANEEDFALLEKKGVKPCLCPTSNLHLTGKLPAVQAMLETGLKPCLGTDGAVSGASFNLFKEMAALLDAGIDADAVLAMATKNGAEALGLGLDFGRLEEGGAPALLNVACEGKFEDPLEDAIRSGAQGWVTWVIRPDGAFNSLLKDAPEEEAS
jgi:cytosine/adenosine deaminase-related metal-dependent hydrolase